jgi:hypothetical protein
VALVVACNGLIGLDDFERVECTGGKCDGGGIEGGGFDGGGDATPDGPVNVVDAAGTLPVSWAHFRMPNYPQDGGPDANLMSYEPTTGGVHDKVSGLVWREPIAEKGPHSFDDAKAICEAAPSGPWRLPSRIELVTLLDLTQGSPSIDKATFPSTEAIAYWTSSVVRDTSGAPTNQIWTVDFGGSPGVDQTDATGTAGVRCIKTQ